MLLFGFWRCLTCGLLITGFSSPLTFAPDRPITVPNHFSGILHASWPIDVSYDGREARKSSNHHSIRILRQVRGLNHTVTMIRFDYTAGTASRAVADEDSGEMLQEQKLAGRPQSSRQEFEAAVLLIRQSSELSNLMINGAVPEGGFIVDGPAGHSIRDRYIQIRLLSPDRLTLLRVVLVDLTAQAVASARASFE